MGGCICVVGLCLYCGLVGVCADATSSVCFAHEQTQVFPWWRRDKKKREDIVSSCATQTLGETTTGGGGDGSGKEEVQVENTLGGVRVASGQTCFVPLKLRLNGSPLFFCF